MPKKLMKDIIRENRLRQKLTQENLADIVMVSNKTISKWENGNSYPDTLIIPRLSEALGITIYELYGLEYNGENLTNFYNYYGGKINKTVRRENYLLSLFNESLEKNYFKLYFQPQINSIDNSVFSAEVLIRWIHPKEGTIMPDEFISLLERSNLIAELDKYVWEETIKYLSILHDEKLYRLSLSINVSRSDFNYLNVANELINLVEKYNVSPTRLNIEITESAFCENSTKLINDVIRLQNYGFCIEMDDFGSGYSSLNVLKLMPINVIKLDMLFLRNLNKEYKSIQVIDSIIDLAHRLCMPIIAEGVETEEQVKMLQNMNCYLMQGFYFSKPLSSTEFEQFLGCHNIIACLEKSEKCKKLGYDNYRNYHKYYGFADKPIMVIKPYLCSDFCFKNFNVVYYNKALFYIYKNMNNDFNTIADEIKLNLEANQIAILEDILNKRIKFRFDNVLINDKKYSIFMYPISGADDIVIVFE